MQGDELTTYAQSGVEMLTQEPDHPPSYDSSPLLLNDGNDKPLLPEEHLPPLWVRLIFFAIMMIPFIIIPGSCVVLIVTDVDPLGFSFLAFLLLFSLVPSLLAITLLVSIPAPRLVESCPLLRKTERVN